MAKIPVDRLTCLSHEENREFTNKREGDLHEYLPLVYEEVNGGEVTEHHVHNHEEVCAHSVRM